MAKKLVNLGIAVGPLAFRDHMFVETEKDEKEVARDYYGDMAGEPCGEWFVFPKVPGEPRVCVVSVLEVEDQMAELVQSLVRA